jgi:putative addiction module component (TIGR02574 family)
MTTALLKQATKLPLSDRIKLVEDIWNSIADEPKPDPFPLMKEQERELDRRLALMKKNPNRALPWAEAKRRILKRHATVK